MAPSAISDIAFGRAAPGICVRDIAAAHDFYARVLGFAKVFENGDPVGFMVLKKDEAEIHLSRKSDHKSSTVNVMHIFVSDAAALYARCEAEDVRIIKRLTDKDYGQRAFVFADPDGDCRLIADGNASHFGGELVYQEHGRLRGRDGSPHDGGFAG